MIKLDIQRFAQAQVALTMVFDEHIQKVTCDNTSDNTTYEWTTSGQVSPIAKINYTFTANVVLDEGYEIDTVVASPTSTTISDITANSFNGDGFASNTTITITSKKTAPSCTFQRFAKTLDKTVTFVVNDENYAISTIKDGQTIASPSPNPTATNKEFKGWYDAKSGGTKIEFPYTPDGNKNLFARFLGTQIMTVSGLGNSDPSTVTFDVPDDFQFTDGEFVDSNGNVFIKIPTMYRKINATSDGQITSWSISNKKVDDNYQVFPVFLKEDGVTILPWVGIGKYASSNKEKPNSVNANEVSVKIGVARSNVKSNYNSNYQLYDWMFHILWQNLIICAKKAIDVNPWDDGSQVDALGIVQTEVILDGIGKVDNYIYMCDKPSKYVDSPTASTSGYFTTSYRIATTTDANYAEVQKLGYDETHPFANFPSSAVSNSYFNTYYCDRYRYQSGSGAMYICPCLSWKRSADGAFYSDFYLPDFDIISTVRLCYRPLDEA